MAIKHLGKISEIKKNEGEIEMKVDYCGDVKTGFEKVSVVSELKQDASGDALIEPMVHVTVDVEQEVDVKTTVAQIQEDKVEDAPQPTAESVKTKNQKGTHPSRGGSKYEFTLAKSKGQIRKKSRKRVFSIYNTLGCKKIMIPAEIVEKARLSELIQVGFTEEGVILGKVLSANKKGDGYFEITRHGSVYILCSSPLVEEITKEFNLKYGKGSLKFTEMEYTTANRRKAVHIKLV